MLFERLREEQHFTKNEKTVSRYILANVDQIPSMTAGRIASACFTSKASVVRLSQKLGLSGFLELKLKLIAELNQRNRISALLSNEPITDRSSYSEIIQTVAALSDKAITNTRLSLDEETMQRIADELADVERIDIYGTGVSYHLAQAAAFKFATLGIDSSAYESINAHALAARNEKPTLCLVISFTGANRSVKQIAKYLSEVTDNYIVGLLGPHCEGMERWCDDIIEISNRDSLLSLDVISSFCAANYVLDSLFGLILSNHYQEHLASSLKTFTHASLLFGNAYGAAREDGES